MRQVRERLYLGDITDAYAVLQSPKTKVTHMLSMLAMQADVQRQQNTALGDLSSPVTMGSPSAVKSPQDGAGLGFPEEEKRSLVRKIVPLKDVETENLLDHLESCLQFIEEARGSGGVVLVHCQAGISRSASVVTAYLMRTEKMPLVYALASLRRVSDIVCPNEGFMEQLRMFEEMGFGVDRESPIYRQFRVTYVTGGSFRCVPGSAWVSVFNYVNKVAKGRTLRRSSFMNHVHNVAPPVKRKAGGTGISAHASPDAPPFRVRFAQLWRRGTRPS